MSYILDPSNGLPLAYISEKLKSGDTYQAFRCAAEREQGAKPEFTITVKVSNSNEYDFIELPYGAVMYRCDNVDYIELL